MMRRQIGDESIEPTSRSRRGCLKALAVISGVVVLGVSGLWGLEKALVGFPKNPATVEGIKRELREATPVGCSQARVLAWVDPGASGSTVRSTRSKIRPNRPDPGAMTGPALPRKDPAARSA